jgi:hypothetical protein
MKTLAQTGPAGLRRTMKRRLTTIAFALVLGLTVGLCRAAETNQPPEKPKLWFPVGEKLTYKVYWGFIPVAKTEIKTEWIEENGKTLLAIRYRTRSNRVIATIYPVDDRIESIIDPVTFRPVRFSKNLREGRHRYHETTIFDYQRLKATWTSFVKKKEKVYDIEPDTRDLITFMYYMRSKRVKPGDKRHYRVMADEKIYDLYLKIGKKTSVELDNIGTVSCLQMVPKAKFQGLFVRKGKVTMLVSRDQRRLCTQIRAKIPVGSIKVRLHKVEGPGNDRWVRAAD